MNSTPLSLIIGRIVTGILVVAIVVLSVRAIRDEQAKRATDGKEDVPKGTAGPATEYLALAAIIPWPLFAVAFLFRTTPVPLAPLCWLAGSVFALLGASVCLFGVSKERRKNDFSVICCTWACCGAVFISVLLFVTG